jgi:Fe2+ or Zn2+ uptake regulation protein
MSEIITVSDKKDILNPNHRTFEEREKELQTISEAEAKRKEDEKKNKNFVMMYREHMPEMRWLMQKNGKAASILNFIIEHMDNKNALMASNAVFADYFDISTKTVQRCIKFLYDNGFVDILKSGTSNVYIVNHNVAWCSWDNQKKYSQFDGKILISATDNKDYEYRSQYDKFKQLRERENIKA